jgi:hypothetical protein
MWVKPFQQFATIVLLNAWLVATAAAANEDTVEAPSMELLEFLGEFQTEDGEWIDPLDLLDMEQNEQPNEQPNEQQREKLREKQRNDEDQSHE